MISILVELENSKTIVFSQWEAILLLIKKAAQEIGISCAHPTSKSSKKYFHNQLSHFKTVGQL